MFIDADNKFWEATLAENEVAAELLYADALAKAPHALWELIVILVISVESVEYIEELKLLIVVNIDADSPVKFSNANPIEVDKDELTFNIVDSKLALIAFTIEALVNNVNVSVPFVLSCNVCNVLFAYNSPATNWVALPEPYLICKVAIYYLFFFINIKFN